jgi:hypothetical protein
MKKNVEGWIQIMIYLKNCKKYCKCHNVSPPSTTVKKRENIDCLMLNPLSIKVKCLWKFEDYYVNIKQNSKGIVDVPFYIH